MSVLDIFGFSGGGPGDYLDAFAGRAGAEASLEGAEAQIRLGREAMGAGREAEERLEQDLAPFVGMGTSRIGRGRELFGPNAAQSVINDPAFQAAAQRQQLQTLAKQAAGGRLGTAETGGAIQSGLMNLGSDFLSRERGDILRQIQTGQASAAQQASSNLQASGRSADILTQIGAAQAAGGMGAAQAYGQGTSNMASLAGGIMSFFSDRRLKKNITKVGTHKGHNKYLYQYKGDDTWYIGVMSDEVKAAKPQAVSYVGGFDCVDYGAL
jgi:hypothetical protein